MAAKKRTKKSAKAVEENKPAQPLASASEQPVESSTPPTDAAPIESKPGRPGPPVAGIGASAGGLNALKKFFAAMPAESGIGFVLIPHLDPKHESLMVELLARSTKMPVAEAKAGMTVEADHVY